MYYGCKGSTFSQHWQENSGKTPAPPTCGSSRLQRQPTCPANNLKRLSGTISTHAVAAASSTVSP